MLKIKLVKNLRKSILQGHPWLYKDAIEDVKDIQEAQACKVVDGKNKVLAWGYYDPYSVIAVRILSTAEKPPNSPFIQRQILNCVATRRAYFQGPKTNAFRLINGEGDRLPGLVCDVYDQLAILQTDGLGPSQYWDLSFVAEILLNSEVCTQVYHKPRGKNEVSLGSWREPYQGEPVEILENAVKFNVDTLQGQKTGFFLDQRDNREYLKSWVKDKSVINMFSYTGGFSVYAGQGGARRVTSVDISPKAIALSEENWKLNKLPDVHEGLCEDVFSFIENTEKTWDAVVVDPPSMAHSEKQKTQAIAKYTDLFAKSAKRVSSGGDLFLSSCSSHISFDDFYEIAVAALSQSRKTAQILRFSGQGADHPYLHICPEQRYLKFMHLKLNG